MKFGPAILERLVDLSFQTVRVDEDTNRPSGVVYSPNLRDDAETARNSAFKMLCETPAGRRTKYCYASRRKTLLGSNLLAYGSEHASGL